MNSSVTCVMFYEKMLMSVYVHISSCRNFNMTNAQHLLVVNGFLKLPKIDHLRNFRISRFKNLKTGENLKSTDSLM